MATKTMGARASRRAEIPVRRITEEDLRHSLRQGLDDFKELRGDLVFAGLIYTFIGLAAVVMTTNGPLMPFFFPVVAGVALFGPATAVGFYELARRRERGQEVHWWNFLDLRKRPSVDDMGIVAGLMLAIFVVWLFAAGMLYLALFGWATPTSFPGSSRKSSRRRAAGLSSLLGSAWAQCLRGSSSRSASHRCRCWSTAT